MRFKQWNEEFGRVGDPPERPEVPTYLRLYFELQRWPGHLLVSGGIMDQPSWSWEMIDIAGMTYRQQLDKNREAMNTIGD